MLSERLCQHSEIDSSYALAGTPCGRRLDAYAAIRPNSWYFAEPRQSPLIACPARRKLDQAPRELPFDRKVTTEMRLWISPN
jgi:hypothetical protein